MKSTYKAEDYARLYIYEILRLLWIPQSIIQIEVLNLLHILEIFPENLAHAGVA